MVVDSVEVAQFLPREVGDVLGISARYVLVGQAGKQGFSDRPLHRRLR